jgi:predicted AAA+ superfamily ATPase
MINIIKMDKLYFEHIRLVNALKSDFRRDFIDEVDWNERMLAIKGARGVGKTTLILQHIKESFGLSKKALYVSMDNLHLASMSIREIADYHYQHGGTHLFIDEIHKYSNWSIELKNIYDGLPDLFLVFSSSSILQIYQGNADLSRRVVSYHLRGLSLREYIQIETKTRLPTLSFKEIVEDHVEVCSNILKTVKPLSYFRGYLEYGYYPFYLQNKKTYYQKINTILNVILEVDMPYILDINIHNVNKIKRLLKVIADSVPFQPNISKLAEIVELNRNTLTQYLYYLEQSEIIGLLTSPTKSYGHLTKPEKIYLQNPNYSYAFGSESPNIGTLRELFFLNQLKVKEQVNFTKSGDFIVNEKFVFEIGGPKKSFKQIADLQYSYLALDEIEMGFNSKIPLWLFGFLY